MNPDFWRGRRVLVTGHTGFKGSWLCLWLAGMGARCVGYALAPDTEPSLFELAQVERDVTSVIGDIRDRESLRAVMQREQPEVVLHLAAQPLVRRSYADPVGTFDVNVMGTVHLLEAVRACASVRAVVVVTSDKCYENLESSHAYNESDPMGGHDPYSSSKGCAELACAAYRRSYFSATDSAVGIATARAGNVIGGGDWGCDRLIPDVLRAARAGQPIELRNPRATRPWQHVLEPLAGYLMLAERLHAQPQRWAGAWNFGPADHDVREVQWVVQALFRLLGIPAGMAIDPHPQAHEAQRLALDNAKAANLLGWTPRWGLNEALAAIAEWQLAATSPSLARDITLRQIARYQSAWVRETPVAPSMAPSVEPSASRVLHAAA